MGGFGPKLIFGIWQSPKNEELVIPLLNIDPFPRKKPLNHSLVINSFGSIPRTKRIHLPIAEGECITKYVHKILWEIKKPFKISTKKVNKTASSRYLSTGRIYVPDDYPSIQEAVDHARPGDTIIVRDGVYTENIKINKTLTIMSENGSHNCTVTAQDIFLPVFRIEADHVNIIDFSIQYCFAPAICLENVEGCYLIGNNCSYSFTGISLEGADNNFLIANKCSYCGIGIELFFSTNNMLRNNTMFRCGLAMEGSTLDHFIHDIDISNTVNGKPVLYLKNESGKDIRMDAGEIILVDCHNISIENLYFEWTNEGIIVAFSDHIHLHNITCLNCGACIDVCGSTSCTISSCNCSLSGVGIWLLKSSNNILSNNICQGNRYDGIFLEASDTNLVSNNVLNNNSMAIYIVYSFGNVLRNNSMHLNGIVVDGSIPLHFLHDIDTSNRVNDKPVYYWVGKEGKKVPPDAGEVILANCRNILVEGENLSNSSVGIEIVLSSSITVNNNTLLRVFPLLYYVEGIFFSNNRIYSNYLYLESVRRSVFSNNFLYDTMFDLVLFRDNEISNNTLTESEIWFVFATRNRFHQNTLLNHSSLNVIISWNNDFSDSLFKSSELYIGYSIGDKILDNRFYGSWLGVGIRYALASKIHHNDIRNNSLGLFLFHTFCSSIKYNNFIGNAKDAYFENSMCNVWLKNYWDDWRGIGPMVIEGKLLVRGKEIKWFNLDYLPSREPYDFYKETRHYSTNFPHDRSSNLQKERPSLGFEVLSITRKMKSVEFTPHVIT